MLMVVMTCQPYAKSSIPELRKSITSSWAGSHSWKMGVASVRAPNTEDLTGNPLGTWTFSTDQVFNPNTPATIAALSKPSQFSASMPPVVLPFGSIIHMPRVFGRGCVPSAETPM